MTWNGPLNKIDEFRYEIPSSYTGEKNNLTMKTSAVIYANSQMIEAIKRDNALEQAANVAMLPGIVGKSLAMPDIHWGYGFCIGGVAATVMAQSMRLLTITVLQQHHLLRAHIRRIQQQRLV